MAEVLMYLRKSQTKDLMDQIYFFTTSKFDLKWPSVGEKIPNSKSSIISFLKVT